MDIQPKISIVVPVYNVSQHIERCLLSILHQSYDYYEVIIVNDGSTDDSAIKCDNFIKQTRDPRFKIFNKDNGGLSDARNYGLDRTEVSSEYVFFLDSDDEITNDCLEQLVKRADRDSLVISPLTRCQIGNKPLMRRDNKILSYTYPWRNSDFLYRLKDGIINSCCGKCYSLNIIRKYNLRFENTLPEDTLFNIAYIDKINSICYLYSSFYYYYIWGQSMSTHADERVFYNYIRIQKMLYERIPFQCENLIDKFVYPQYRVNAMNYIRCNDFSLLGKYLSDYCVKKAFQSYIPVSLGDRIIHLLLKHRLFKVIRLLVND